MSNTKAKQPKPLTDKEIMEVLNLADIDRKAIESEIESQAVVDKNATDMVLIDKVEMLLVVLEHPYLEDIEKGFAFRKLQELIGRM